jgi:hypothetical protein
MIKVVEFVPAALEREPQIADVEHVVDVVGLDFISCFEWNPKHEEFQISPHSPGKWILMSVFVGGHEWAPAAMIEGGEETEWYKEFKKFEPKYDPEVLRKGKELPPELEETTGELALRRAQQDPEGYWLIVSASEGKEGPAFWSINDGWQQFRRQGSCFGPGDREMYANELPETKGGDAEWRFVGVKRGFSRRRADPYKKLLKIYHRGSRYVKVLIKRLCKQYNTAEAVLAQVRQDQLNRRGY